MPKPDKQKSLKILSQPRPLVAKITQFITSFSNLGYHSKNKKEITEEQAKCRLCQKKLETVWHLATECENLTYTSIETFGHDGPLNGNWEVSDLLRFLNNSRLSRLMETRINPNQEDPDTDDDVQEEETNGSE